MSSYFRQGIFLYQALILHLITNPEVPGSMLLMFMVNLACHPAELKEIRTTLICRLVKPSSSY